MESDNKGYQSIVSNHEAFLASISLLKRKALRCLLGKGISIPLVFLFAILFSQIAVQQARGAVVIQGTVTDRPTNAPIAGAFVKSPYDVSNGLTGTLTDANGAYAIAAQQGIPINGNLDIRHDGYFYVTPPYDLAGGTPVTVNATLQYGGTVIQGVVTDSTTHLPITSFTIRVTDSLGTIVTKVFALTVQK